LALSARRIAYVVTHAAAKSHNANDLQVLVKVKQTEIFKVQYCYAKNTQGGVSLFDGKRRREFAYMLVICG